MSGPVATHRREHHPTPRSPQWDLAKLRVNQLTAAGWFDDALVLEALNHYDRPGNDRITVRAAAFTDRGPDGRVRSVRLYQDVSALFAPQT